MIYGIWVWVNTHTPKSDGRFAEIFPHGIGVSEMGVVLLQWYEIRVPSARELPFNSRFSSPIFPQDGALQLCLLVCKPH